MGSSRGKLQQCQVVSLSVTWRVKQTGSFLDWCTPSDDAAALSNVNVPHVQSCEASLLTPLLRQLLQYADV